MSTYQQLQDRVNLDYLNRSDFVSETQRSIKAAIRKYERRRWWFNETSTALTTVASQDFLAFPADFFTLDLLQITYSGATVELSQRDYKWIQQANAVNTTGVPTDYAIYQNRINFFPTPDSAYSVPVSYLKKLDVLSAGADTTEWTSAVEDVIVYHATKLMWATVLRNTENAATFQALEQEALVAATKENEQRLLTSIKPTRY